MSTAGRRAGPAWAWVFALALLAAASGCKKDTENNTTTTTTTTTAPIRTALLPNEDLPGVVIAISSVSGASGADGTFRSGDFIAVRFTVRTTAGTNLPPSELNSSAIYVSGPTFNYQRVIPSVSNWHTAAVQNSDNSYTYTFTTAIPTVYAAPYNDTASFGSGDGELQGQTLLAGTYTIGMQAYKNYTVGATTFRDVANVTEDFLFGGATTLAPREVVKATNCNQCHVTLQAHGGSRRDPALCILCHTAGSEDKNVGSVAGGTPGVSVDFKVMIHKIHNGSHLPSVLGVTTAANGSRNYAATAAPYQLVGYQNSINDFSGVVFPVWPNLSSAMPRDQGYGALTAGQQTLENTMRTGVTACAKCHGDPDDSGPLTAPSQGQMAYSQPTRAACGSCHDDVVWTNDYVANGQTMAAQTDDSSCITCHTASGTSLSNEDAHIHPQENSALNAGLNLVVTAATPSLGATLDPGEKLGLTFTIKNDAGTDVQPSGLSINIAIAGPTHNRNILLYGAIPTASLGAVAASYTLNAPERLALESLGTATGGADVKTTSRTPHWNVTGDLTSVLEATFTGTTTTLSAAAPALQNYVEVASAAGIANDDYVVLDRGLGTEEYVRVRRVVGNRLWMSTRYDTSVNYKPYLRTAHANGGTVERVTVAAKTVTTAWSLTNAATGQITLVAGQFTAGRGVIASYTTDFVMPSVYPPTLNDSPDQDETWGEWTAKSIVDGTYTVGLWGAYSWTYNPFSDGVAAHNNSYRTTADGGNRDFLVGTATTVVPYAIIDLTEPGGNCNNCHNQILFHGGGRRDVDTCLMCHGVSGAEDWPIYRSAFPANSTTGVNVNFRTMLHKIHMGAELTNGATYVVNGNGGTGHTYEEVEFPAMPNGVKHCTKCHGTSNTAWKEPADRDHPTQQTLSVRTWRAVCGSCHDDASTAAHIDVQTSAGGVESCATCHGDGKEYNVELMHKNR